MKYLQSLTTFIFENQNIYTKLEKLGYDKQLTELIYTSIENYGSFQSKYSKTMLLQDKIMVNIKWLIYIYENQYRKNLKLFTEDINKLIKLLDDLYFYNFNKKINNSYLDLFKNFKTDKELFKIINDVKTDSNNKELKFLNKYNEFIKNNEAEIVYEDNYWFVIWTKTEDANKFYGENTNWCTIGGAFKNYNNEGKLYILIDKEKIGTKELNRRIQVHFETTQFMDMSDTPYLSMFDINNYKNKGLINYFKNDIENIIEINLDSYNRNNNRLKQLNEFIKGLYIFKNLEHLYLGNNNLEELPKEIGLLKNLIVIQLNNNKLEKLPIEFYNLKKLKVIHLNDNILNNLSKEIFNLIDVEWLSLYNNNLTELPIELINLKKLLYLNINNNNLTELPNWLKEIKNKMV